MITVPGKYQKYGFSVKFTSKNDKLDYVSKHVCVPTMLYNDFIEEGCLKEMIVFFQLKGMYNGGIIFNYRGRMQELSKVCGVSESTFRKRINWLFSNGYLLKSGLHLEIIGKSKLVSRFGYKTKKGGELKRFKKDYVSKETFGLLYCRKKLVEINQKSQRYKLIQNIKRMIINKECGKHKIAIPIDYSVKRRGDDIRVYIKDVDQAIDDYGRAFEKDRMDRNIFYKFSPFDINSSRGNIARQFGCISKSTGSRFIQKVKKSGICVVEDMENYKLFKTGVDLRAYKEFLQFYGIGYGKAIFRAYNTKVKGSLGNIYIRLSNIVKFTDISRFILQCNSMGIENCF